MTRKILEVAPQTVSLLYQLHENYPDGVDIFLSEGDFFISQTVVLPSYTNLIGRGRGATKINLVPRSGCHIFTNDNHDRGNVEISARGFTVNGNSITQLKPEGMKGITFCCAFYFKKLSGGNFIDLDFNDIRQTALHFNGSAHILVDEVCAHGLGWSGLSTSDASNMRVRMTVSGAGRDVMHSALHFDGGVGIYCDVIVTDTTGNGIMLDSNYAQFRNCIVKGDVSGCKRGVSLSGSARDALENVVVSGNFHNNREVGVMISNASNVAVINSEIRDNGEWGILMQGRNGGCNVNIADCIFERNGNDIGELHASRGNWVFDSDKGGSNSILPGTNARHLKMHAADIIEARRRRSS